MRLCGRLSALGAFVARRRRPPSVSAGWPGRLEPAPANTFHSSCKRRSPAAAAAAAAAQCVRSHALTRTGSARANINIQHTNHAPQRKQSARGREGDGEKLKEEKERDRFYPPPEQPAPVVPVSDEQHQRHSQQSNRPATIAIAAHPMPAAMNVSAPNQQLASNRHQEQEERDQFAHKFEAWSSQDQVEFVERLLGKMAHCQHRKIDAALQPMLERDFIHSMMPSGQQPQASQQQQQQTGALLLGPVGSGPPHHSLANGSSGLSNQHKGGPNGRANSPINANGTNSASSLASSPCLVFSPPTNGISSSSATNTNSNHSTSLTDSIKSCYEKWSLGGSGLADLASVSGSDSPLDPDPLFGGSPLAPVHHNPHHHHHHSHSNHHHQALGHLDSHQTLASNVGSLGSLANEHHHHHQMGQFHHPSTVGHQQPIGTTSPHITDPLMDLSAKLINSATLLPIKSQCKRQKMIYHCKFGEFGIMEGQFTEPSGVAVNAQNDIIVADTNNHRIQIFDNEGRFKFQFGECGKRDGQLLYPNRVAVVKSSGDIIVTERSPTHQIQVYTQYGQFVRKFGANILQHPRGVTVDNKGRIIVVECKVMRVIIFDQLGNALHKFGCSKHLEFPNGVVVNDKQEIFISDNRAHCVKVFSYEGQFLRQIGGEGLTNYPIGVCINDAGEILVADNHNNFNITIFNQDGTLISALESKVKHAQCFDVALMDDNSVVLASKDYRIYIYRYLQMQALTTMTTFD